MAKKFWTLKETEFIKEYYPDNGSAFCAEKLNRTRNSIKSRAQHLHLKRNNRHVLTDNEIKYIEFHYPHRRTVDIANELGISVNSIYRFIGSSGIKKTPEFLASPASGIMRKGTTRGKNTQFKKGHIPANKGKKMLAEHKRKIKHTFFPPGHQPVNTLYDGAITIRKDNRGVFNKFIRISKSNWQYMSNYLWEQHNGPIPKGFNVVYKDGNTLNCVIENLELISDAELMQRNTIQRYPQELKQTIRALGKLNKTILKHEEQD